MLSGFGKQAKDLLSGISDNLPGIPEIRLFSTHEFPVYVIHRKDDPEDYFFLFDFWEFDEKAKASRFARPAFKVWAGRDDFHKQAFGHAMRQSFEAAYRMQREELSAHLKPNQKKRFTFWQHVEVALRTWGATSELSAIVTPILFLWIGLIALSRVGSELQRMRNWITKPSNDQRLADFEDRLDRKRNEVDTALALLTIHQHPDLVVNAFGPGFVLARPELRKALNELEVWPLPEFVLEKLEYTTSDLDQS